MQISLTVPGVGLVLIAFNLLIAAVRPSLGPTMMGLQLFLIGMFTILIAVIDLVNPIGISMLERMGVFVAGCINCSAGYYMVLREMRRRAT
jgi:hypothetical protein